MGLVPVERSFPRGRINESSVQSTSKGRVRKNAKPNSSLFGNKSAPKKRNEAIIDGASTVDAKKKDKTPFYRLKQYSGQLTYKTVSEGMLSLGSIYKIEDFQLRVVLPGNVLGVIPITYISEPYTIALRTVMLAKDTDNDSVYQLREMFKIGQHVVTRVVSKVTEGQRNVITLSLVPEVIHADLAHTDVLDGSVLVAAVKSIEEKGYVMELGIKSTRAFLNKDKCIAFEQMWNDNRPLRIGQLVRCVVIKSATADKFTTVVLSAIPDKVAKASADSNGASLETLLPGMQFSVTISRTFPTGVQVQLSDNFVGYVHQDHFGKTFKTSENYEVGTVTAARVLYILQSGAVYFTMKSGVLEAKPRPSPYEAIKLGAVVKKAVVVSVTAAGVTVKVGKANGEALKGFIPLSQLTRKPQTSEEKFDTPLAEQLASEYPIGSKVVCRVISYNFMDQYYSCTMDESLMTEKFIHPDMLELGLMIPCFVKGITLQGITLSLGKKTKVTGFVPIVHVSDVPLSHPEKKYNIGQPCMAKVLSLKNGKVLLTMKPALFKSGEPMLTKFSEARVGDRYEGTVLQVTGKGLLVQFYELVTGWVPPHLLAKRKMTEDMIFKNFYVGQLVRCTIAKKDKENQKLLLSLLEERARNVIADDEGLLDESQENGVRSVTNGSNDEQSPKKKNKKRKLKEKEGMEEQSSEELPKQKKQKVSKKTDSKIETVISGEEPEKKKKKKKNALPEINGFGASATSNAESENEVKSKKKRVPEDSVISEELNVSQKSKKKKKKKTKRKADEDIETVSPNVGKKQAMELPRLSLTSGFVWDATPDKLPIVSATATDPESSSDESSSPSKPAKRSRAAAMAEKRALAQKEEARLREIERRLMDSEQPPQSADEFDRLVLSSPDSSMVWLQYMAYHLQATEIEKARAVAQRALKTISFREEQEKLNVWVALLNLENLYGTKDSLDTTLEEASRVNDAYEVYTRMLQIYSDSNKLQEGDKLIGILTKKFKGHKDMWVNAATFYMKSAQMEKSRALLQRALVGLQKKEHVAMICRFAQLENRLGCAVRAQTLMEQVLTSYPARVDVWSSYVDMLVKSGSVPAARQVLERAVVQRLSSHKMKTLFKKFLAFEEAHGDEDAANRVRQMALDYVESAGGVG